MSNVEWTDEQVEIYHKHMPGDWIPIVDALGHFTGVQEIHCFSCGRVCGSRVTRELAERQDHSLRAIFVAPDR